MGCHEDPTAGHLHMVPSSGEVLPFSNALALVYKYPYTLGEEHPDFHSRPVYSSVYGIPLIAPWRREELGSRKAGSRLRRLWPVGLIMWAT